jgi:hypothetical protein
LPVGALRAQSIVTPARSVWPCEAVDVRYCKRYARPAEAN